MTDPLQQLDNDDDRARLVEGIGDDHRALFRAAFDAAARYVDPETGKITADPDEVIANDPELRATLVALKRHADAIDGEPRTP